MCRFGGVCFSVINVINVLFVLIRMSLFKTFCPYSYSMLGVDTLNSSIDSTFMIEMGLFLNFGSVSKIPTLVKRSKMNSVKLAIVANRKHVIVNHFPSELHFLPLSKK